MAPPWKASLVRSVVPPQTIPELRHLKASQLDFDGDLRLNGRIECELRQWHLKGIFCVHLRSAGALESVNMRPFVQYPLRAALGHGNRRTLSCVSFRSLGRVFLSLLVTIVHGCRHECDRWRIFLSF